MIDLVEAEAATSEEKKCVRERFALPSRTLLDPFPSASAIPVAQRRAWWCGILGRLRPARLGGIVPYLH
jgi:hypothetical protein